MITVGSMVAAGRQDSGAALRADLRAGGRESKRPGLAWVFETSNP